MLSKPELAVVLAAILDLGSAKKSMEMPISDVRMPQSLHHVGHH